MKGARKSPKTASPSDDRALDDGRLTGAGNFEVRADVAGHAGGVAAQDAGQVAQVQAVRVEAEAPRRCPRGGYPPR